MTETIQTAMNRLMTISVEPQDYVAEDGLLYCGSCKTPKEAFFPNGKKLFGRDRHPAECRCRQATREKQEKEERARLVYNRIAYDETNRKIGQNPRESWRMVPDSHPAIISWELFDEVSALREAEQAVKEERKKWCRQRRKNNPNIFKGRIFCKKCGEKMVCHWQSDGTLYFYCASCHVSISEKDLWNGINKELHQRMEEHRDLQKLVRKSSGKSKLQSKEIATKREIEQASGNIVRLESQKRSGYEQYVLGKISKEKFLKLKQDAENEIEAFRQTKAENEKELVVVQEELQQKKQIAGNTEVLLTADNLQQYVKKIEVDHKKNTYTEFVF